MMCYNGYTRQAGSNVQIHSGSNLCIQRPCSRHSRVQQIRYIAYTSVVLFVDLNMERSVISPNLMNPDWEDLSKFV